MTGSIIWSENIFIHFLFFIYLLHCLIPLYFFITKTNFNKLFNK
jgi:hypothetical protein